MARHGWRGARLAAIGGLATCLAMAGAPPALAISAEEKAKLDNGAQETLDELHRLLAEDLANSRASCAMGEATDMVARLNAAYPDTRRSAVAEVCVSILGGTGRDSHLGGLYRDLLTRLGGDVGAADRWPRAIGAAALGSQSTVAIGNGKAMALKPAFAFDAGFTVAYQDGSASQAGEADSGQLQALAEACLAQHQDAGTCFSAGYLYGAAAFRGKDLLVR